MTLASHPRQHRAATRLFLFRGRAWSALGGQAARQRRCAADGGQLRHTAGATAAADAIKLSPRGIALPRSDMSPHNPTPRLITSDPFGREATPRLRPPALRRKGSLFTAVQNALIGPFRRSQQSSKTSAIGSEADYQVADGCEPTLMTEPGMRRPAGGYNISADARSPHRCATCFASHPERCRAQPGSITMRQGEWSQANQL